MLLMTLIFNFSGNAARLAVQAGVAGIIVSNHGARQLDYVPATIMALEEVLISPSWLFFSFHNCLFVFLK